MAHPGISGKPLAKTRFLHVPRTPHAKWGWAKRTGDTVIAKPYKHWEYEGFCARSAPKNLATGVRKAENH